MKRPLFAALLLAWLALPAHAAKISDLETRLDDHQVQVSFRLLDSFAPKLVERIQSGLPTTLSYEVVLARDRKRWFDRDLQSTSLTVSGMYDAVRREYLVNFKQDGRLLESRVVQTLVELERAMTVFSELPLFELTQLPDNRRLLVRARAELGWEHWLGFIPSRLTTSWVESKKFRPPPELVQP